MKLIPVIKALLIIYLLLCTTVYLLQRSIIYRPVELISHGFDTIKFNKNNHTIEAITTHYEESNPDSDVIIYFGGNAENVIYTAHDFASNLKHHTTYLLKYRGYSGAEGQASEHNLYADALAIFDQVSKKHNGNITIVGRSLGSAIATYLASKRPVNQLILVTPFDSMVQVAKGILPILPVDWLLTERFDSKSRASAINVPTLIITAENDEVIPFARTESLINSIPVDLVKTTVIEAGHNDIDLAPQYFKEIQQFVFQIER